jgi:hypothetical protein
VEPCSASTSCRLTVSGGHCEPFCLKHIDPSRTATAVPVLGDMDGGDVSEGRSANCGGSGDEHRMAMCQACKRRGAILSRPRHGVFLEWQNADPHGSQ